MKIFDIVRSLTNKISNIFADVVGPRLVSRKKLEKISAERIKKGRKSGKRRRSFNSFLREHDSSLKSASSRIKKRISRATAQTQGQYQFKKLIMNEDDSWSSAYNL